MADKTVAVKLVRAYWLADGVDGRLEPGEVVDLPVDEARRLLNAGVAQRIDPLPGE